MLDCLSKHRDVEPSLKKEVHCFDLVFEKGIGWYRAHFPLESRMSGRVTFEATPSYLASVGAPSRMYSVIPDVKLVVLLRDHVERAHSSWKLYAYEDSDGRPYGEAIEVELAGVTRHTMMSMKSASGRRHG